MLTLHIFVGLVADALCEVLEVREADVVFGEAHEVVDKVRKSGERNVVLSFVGLWELDRGESGVAKKHFVNELGASFNVAGSGVCDNKVTVAFAMISILSFAK